MPASSQSTPASTAICAVSSASSRLVRSSEIWTIGEVRLPQIHAARQDITVRSGAGRAFFYVAIPPHKGPRLHLRVPGPERAALRSAREGAARALGVQLLGPHGGSQKARVPTDPARLRAIAAVSGVESIAYAQEGSEGRARGARRRRRATRSSCRACRSSSARSTRRRSRSCGPGSPRPRRPVGRVDAVAALDLGRRAGRAPRRARRARHRALRRAEPARRRRPRLQHGRHGRGLHPARRLRHAASPARRYDLGILDTGFMVAAPRRRRTRTSTSSAAAATSPATRPASGTTSTATAPTCSLPSSGTGRPRRGSAAPRPASAAAHDPHPRRQDLEDLGQRGHPGQERERQDYHGRRAPTAAATAPQVVSVSGGASGMNQNGTDARSRKLDQRVWDARQTWVVCARQHGPGAGTIWSPGVAKNALTVGNVQRHRRRHHRRHSAANSSHGPTGDGRMKPNLSSRRATSSPRRSAGTTNHYTEHERLQHGDAARLRIAATVMEHYPEFRTLPHLMRAHLMSTALLHDNVTAPVNNTPAPDATRNTFGLGRVSALRRPLGPPPTQRLVYALGVADDHRISLGLPRHRRAGSAANAWSWR